MTRLLGNFIFIFILVIGGWIIPKVSDWLAPCMASISGRMSLSAAAFPMNARCRSDGGVARLRPGGRGFFSGLPMTSAMAGAGDHSSRDAGADSAWQAEGYHVPVLLDEVVAALKPQMGQTIFDGTAGGGGHSEALLLAGARVVASDRDTAALAHACRRLAEFGDRFSTSHGSFTEMRRWLDAAGVDLVDGILLDIGVSSHQLDDASRGFSFQQGGPLDMRMDHRTDRSAADWINDETEEELARIFFEYGEERASRRVASAIVKARAEQRIDTTDALAAVVESVIPRHGARHPATKIFQGLRIAVNDELGELEAGLEAAQACLKPGGRLAVISFHSLEDRLVKRFMRRHAESTVDRPEWPAPRPNPECYFERKLPKSVTASAEETKMNPRARSARLRVAVRRAASGSLENL